MGRLGGLPVSIMALAIAPLLPASRPTLLRFWLAQGSSDGELAWLATPLNPAKLGGQVVHFFELVVGARAKLAAHRVGEG